MKLLQIFLTGVACWAQAVGRGALVSGAMLIGTSSSATPADAAPDNRQLYTSVIEGVSITANGTLNLGTFGITTVNTSGTAVTGTSGSIFTPDLVGSTVSINAVNYLVSAYTNSTSLTLSTSAGSQTGVTFKAPGTITLIQLATSTSNSTGQLDSKLNIYCDGASSPGEQSDLGTFFHTTGGAGVSKWYSSLYGGISNQAYGVSVGAFRQVSIPYKTGCTIDVKNGDASNAGTIWSQIYYQTGATPAVVTGTTRNVWHEKWVSTSVSQYAAVDLLPAVTAAGEVESVYLIVLSNANYGYLEGNPTWTIDGATTVTAGGTEDYFGGQYYWASGANGIRADNWGAWLGTDLPNCTGGSFCAAMYRYHYPASRIVFNSSARFQWFNGQNGQGSAPGTVNILALVTYWTTQ